MIVWSIAEQLGQKCTQFLCENIKNMNMFWVKDLILKSSEVEPFLQTCFLYVRKEIWAYFLCTCIKLMRKMTENWPFPASDHSTLAEKHVKMKNTNHKNLLKVLMQMANFPKSPKRCLLYMHSIYMFVIRSYTQHSALLSIWKSSPPH